MLLFGGEADLTKRTELLGTEKSYTPQRVFLTIRQGGAVSPNSACCRCGSKSAAEKAKSFWNGVGEALGKQVLRHR